MPDAGDVLQLENVEKSYGGLRPLRVRDLHVAPASITSLLGFDEPAAEMFVNLITGATLPEKGSVRSLGLDTASIASGDDWLRFVERFGFVSRRIVLLEGMTVAQNLALPFDLELEPIRLDVVPRVTLLADEVQIDNNDLTTNVAQADAMLRARTWLARSLAHDPEMLVADHPSAGLSVEQSKTLAKLLREISERRRLTTIVLTMDEKFAREVGGRLLEWQPATGEFRARRRWF